MEMWWKKGRKCASPFSMQAEIGADLFSARRLLDRFTALSLKDSALSGTWETPSSPRTAAPLSGLISRYGSAAHCRISGIAARLSDRYGV